MSTSLTRSIITLIAFTRIIDKQINISLDVFRLPIAYGYIYVLMWREGAERERVKEIEREKEREKTEIEAE